MIKKVKKGFTLIELVVVIAVIAILSAVSVVAYVGITNNAKKSTASQKGTQVVTTIRAGVLASDKGYTGHFDEDGLTKPTLPTDPTPAQEEEYETALAAYEAAYAEWNYTITIDNRLLTISFNPAKIVDGTDKTAQVLILNDMLLELEEKDLLEELGSVEMEKRYLLKDALGSISLAIEDYKYKQEKEAKKKK